MKTGRRIEIRNQQHFRIFKKFQQLMEKIKNIVWCKHFIKILSGFPKQDMQILNPYKSTKY
jgi:hypothetical protein